MEKVAKEERNFRG